LINSFKVEVLNLLFKHCHWNCDLNTPLQSSAVFSRAVLMPGE
jgi:hypothetical protein